MELEAKIIQSLGIQSGTSKSGTAWQKAEILVETVGQYPKKIKLDNMKEATAFSQLPVGYVCKFHIDIDSREFNGRWYTNVNCYKWEFPQGQQPQQPPQQQYAQPQPYQQPQQTQTPPQNYGQQPLPGMPEPQPQENLPF